MTKIRKVTEEDFYEAQENFNEWQDQNNIGGMCHYQNYNLGDEINISSVLIEKWILTPENGGNYLALIEMNPNGSFNVYKLHESFS
jgi:hypothetical protein